MVVWHALVPVRRGKGGIPPCRRHTSAIVVDAISLTSNLPRPRSDARRRGTVAETGPALDLASRSQLRTGVGRMARLDAYRGLLHLEDARSPTDAKTAPVGLRRGVAGRIRSAEPDVELVGRGFPEELLSSLQFAFVRLFELDRRSAERTLLDPLRAACRPIYIALADRTGELERRVRAARHFG